MPSPDRSAALWIQVCVSFDAYTVSFALPSPVMPCWRTSQSAWATRAARKPSMLAMFPPLTMIPPHGCGKPRRSAIQRTA